MSSSSSSSSSRPRYVPYRKRTTTSSLKSRSYKYNTSRSLNRFVSNRITNVRMPMGRNMGNGFPDRYCTKLRNYTSVSYTGVAGATNCYAIMANGLHNSISSGPISGANPVTVGTAVNIYGLGNLLSADGTYNSTGIYAYYRIISCKVTCRLQNTSAATTDSAYFVVQAVDASGITDCGNVNNAGNNIGTLCEMPNTVSKFVAGQTENSGVTLSSAISTAKVWGLRHRSTLEASEYVGVYGSNPTFPWYFLLWWLPTTTNATSAVCINEIEYYIEFYGRNNLPSTGG